MEVISLIANITTILMGVLAIVIFYFQIRGIVANYNKKGVKYLYNSSFFNKTVREITVNFNDKSIKKYKFKEAIIVGARDKYFLSPENFDEPFDYFVYDEAEELKIITGDKKPIRSIVCR